MGRTDDWLTIRAVAEKLGISHSAVQKRVQRGMAELEAAGQIRRVPSRDDGGPPRWELTSDLVQQWQSDERLVARDPEKRRAAESTEPSHGSELWVAREQIELLQGEIAQLRVENEHLMETALRRAVEDRDAAVAELAVQRAGFARVMREIAAMFDAPDLPR